MASFGTSRTRALVAIGMSLGCAASGQVAASSCWRPAPPVESGYITREVFQEAREEYFSQASFYVACIDRWIEDAQRRYQEMFAQEVETYQLERQDVLDELRDYTGTGR